MQFKVSKYVLLTTSSRRQKRGRLVIYVNDNGEDSYLYCLESSVRI